VKVHILTESWRKDKLAWGNAIGIRKKDDYKAIENLIKRDLIERNMKKVFICSLQVNL